MADGGAGDGGGGRELKLVVGGRPSKLQSLVKMRQNHSQSSELQRPRSIRIVELVLLFLFFPFISSSEAADSGKVITFRFINPNSGKPASGMLVGVTAWNVDVFHSRSDEVVASMNVRTDKAGKIIFHLPDPIPRHLGFSIDPYLNRACSTGEFSPDEVLRSGGIAKYNSAKCGATKIAAIASPGEIVVLDRPLTLWERMWREIP